MKKIFAILMFTVFAGYTLLLAGCDLITLNEQKYMNEIIVRVGDSEINRREFISRLNETVSRYRDQQQQGQDIDMDEVLDETVDSIVARELLIKYTQSKYGELNQYYINEVWKEVYDAINDRLQDIEEEVMELWEIEWPNNPEDEEDEPDFDPREPFDPAIEWDDEKEGFVKIFEETDYDVDPIGDFKRRNNNKGLDKSTYKDIQNEAWERYIRELIQNEGEIGESTEDEDVLERRKEFLYNIFEGNMYINVFEEYYEQDRKINEDAMIRIYKELVTEGKEKYSINIDKYHEDMAENPEDVFYHPSNALTDYAMVSHILIPYSDEQEDKLEMLEEDYNSGKLSAEAYERKVNEIKSNISGRARDEDGFEYGSSLSPEAILSEIESELRKVGDDFNARAEIFNDFIYKYNQDPGVLNNENPYYVNLNDNVDNIMVDEFTDEARRLHNEGQKGDISDLVLSDFGYHIIIYLGTPQNIVKYSDIESVTVEQLYNHRLHPALEKTMYHKIYDKIDHFTPFSSYQQSIISHMKGEIVVELYEDRMREIIED